MRFNELKIKKEVLDSLDKIGFKTLTYTQEITLPSALGSKSFACKAKTGSGKTHCFLIPIANKINPDNKNLQAIIIVPTRELAIQITKRARELMDDFGIKITNLTGGTDTLKEKEKIANTPQVLIGTPEKIAEIAIESGLVNLSSVNTFVVDEADMMLEMGFLEKIDRIAYLCKDSQMMLFSATIPVGLKHFIRKYFKNPLIIEDNEDNYNQNVKHILYPLRNKDKNETLLKIINAVNPYVCLIFANKKDDVDQYYKFLVNNNIECGIVHGSLQSRERKSNIKKALDGKYRFICCSDIAARGIDIDGVSHVISLDFPKNNLEFYVHRAGRAGRLNDTGYCISLFNKEDKETIDKLKEQGIVFEIQEIKNGEFVTLKEFSFSKNKKVDDPLQQKINKAVRLTKSKKVKPNYKKKVKVEVEKVKRKHKREIIRQDIKRQIRQRAISKNKGE